MISVEIEPQVMKSREARFVLDAEIRTKYSFSLVFGFVTASCLAVGLSSHPTQHSPVSCCQQGSKVALADTTMKAWFDQCWLWKQSM